MQKSTTTGPTVPGAQQIPPATRQRDTAKSISVPHETLDHSSRVQALGQLQQSVNRSGPVQRLMAMGRMMNGGTEPATVAEGAPGDHANVTEQTPMHHPTRSQAPIQRVVTLSSPGDSAAWSTFSNDFLDMLETTVGPLSELVTAARNNPNFDLILTGDPASGVDAGHLGATFTEVQQADGGAWQGVQSLTGPTLAALHQNPHVRARTRVEIQFNPDSTALRNKEWYVLMHEFAVHAAEYWPLLKKIIAKKAVAGGVADEFMEGGSMHTDTHHAKLLHRNDRLYEDLLVKSWSHIMDKEIREMLAIEQDRRGDESERKKNRVWNSDKFLDTHQVDVVTQIFNAITGGLDAELHSQLDDHASFKETGDPKASVLKPVTRQLLLRVQAALEAVTTQHEKGWIILNQAGQEEKRTIPWSGTADEHFTLVENAFQEDVLRLRANLAEYDNG